MEQTIAETISKGDILVVPSSGFLNTPAFFEVIFRSPLGSICLRTLGVKLNDKGSYVPSEDRYHDSIYRCGKRGSREFVNTWCGDAYAWDGAPC